MSDPFLGEMRMVSFTFAPNGWAQCNGQLLPIAQNQALFALLGTQYGGNGTTTFALPDLRGRVAIGPAANHPQGAAGGSATVTLSVDQMPLHGHAANAFAGAGTAKAPTGQVFAQDSGSNAMFAGAANATLASGAIASAGQSQPHENMQPYGVVNWIIALQGIFPSRP